MFCAAAVAAALAALPQPPAAPPARPERLAFTHADARLPPARHAAFLAGRAAFRADWRADLPPEVAPLFNAASCAACHIRDGRGHPPAANWPDDDAQSLVVRFAAAAPGLGNGDAQLQDFADAPDVPEGRLVTAWTELPVALAGGGQAWLRQPSYRLATGDAPQRAPTPVLSPRIAPPMIGLGLLAAIPAADLAARADPADADGDGISGRVHWLDAAATVPGRFGHKAEAATLRQQIGRALRADMGVGTEDAALLDPLETYAANLAVPPPRPETPLSGRGGAVFAALRCGACHVPQHTTGVVTPGSGHLAGRAIAPYTDLLLHDMGDELADGGAAATGLAREWRTPPLWGIGLTEQVSGHSFFLHDGRARTIEEAILWHGGEAAAASAGYAAAAAPDRAALIAFLRSR